MKTREIRWWRTGFGREELANLKDAFANEHVSQGPLTAEFERRFARAMGVPYAVATTSGSTALMMALMALGVKRGDEVIVPNRTFVATAHAAHMLGAKVVLVDVREDAPALDVSLVERKITRRTKVVMPVHLNGRAVDMKALRALARKRGLFLVEDACQAMFSRGPGGLLGTQSDAGCFSLGVTKLISTGQGGVVVTRDRGVYERLKLARNHGVADTFEAVYAREGFNFKFTDLQAAIGLAQLGRVRERAAHAGRIYHRYVEGIASLGGGFIAPIPVDVDAGEIPLYFEALCDDREPLRAFLEARGIQTRPFLPDLDKSPHLGKGGSFPRSRRFSGGGVFLPAGPAQPLESVDRVCEALAAYGRRR